MVQYQLITRDEFLWALLWRGEFTRGQLYTVFYLAMLYAFTDEFHQIFTPGRAFQVVDLLMDALGATLGEGAYALYLRRAEVKENRFMHEQHNPDLLPKIADRSHPDYFRKAGISCIIKIEIRYPVVETIENSPQRFPNRFYANWTGGELWLILDRRPSLPSTAVRPTGGFTE